MKKAILILLLFIISHSLLGCTKDTPEPMKPTSHSTAYLSESLPIPYSTIYCDAVYQDILYYIGGDEPDDSFNLIRINLNDLNTTTINLLDILIPTSTTDLTAPEMMLTVNSEDGVPIIHILIYQYDAKAPFAEVMRAYWYQLDESGKLLKALDISDDIADGSYGSINDFLINNSGNAFIVKSGLFNESGKIHSIDPNGQTAFTLICDGYQASLFLYDNEVGMIYLGDTGDDFFIATIDMATKSLTGHKKLDINDLQNRSVGIKEADILFIADKDTVYDFNLTHQLISARFSWADVGIVTDNYYTRAFPLSAERVLFTERYSFDQKSYRLIRPMTNDELVIAEANKSKEVTAITVGLTGPPSAYGTLQQIITAYNKENPDKQVILIEYFEDLLPSAGSDMAMAFQESLEMAIRKFELDIIRDQAPDIVIFRQALSWNRYAELNIFEDLYPYLEADAFDWDNNLYEHIIKAYEVEGKLYGMPMISYPNTLIVRQADILNRGITEWNMDEFIAFVDSFESDKAIFANPTKTAVLDLCLFANGDVFVDWSSQDNVFNRNFITKILHFSNRFIDGNKYADNIPLDIRAQSGDVKLFSKLGASFPGWIPGSLNLHGVIMGEQVSYIGFPSENGSGVITHSEMLVSLTSQCRDKEAAWHFLSYYFTEALADKDFYKGLAERMRGSYQTHSDTSLSSSYSYYIDDDDINAWFGLFEGDVQIRIYDQTIENIIKEEAESYFSGGKSLDDVVDVIEKRVILYVHETS